MIKAKGCIDRGKAIISPSMRKLSGKLLPTLNIPACTKDLWSMMEQKNRREMEKEINERRRERACIYWLLLFHVIQLHCLMLTRTPGADIDKQRLFGCSWIFCSWSTQLFTWMKVLLGAVTKTNVRNTKIYFKYRGRHLYEVHLAGSHIFLSKYQTFLTKYGIAWQTNWI